MAASSSTSTSSSFYTQKRARVLTPKHRKGIKTLLPKTRNPVPVVNDREEDEEDNDGPLRVM